MDKEIERVLYSKEVINDRVKELAKHYDNKQHDNKQHDNKQHDNKQPVLLSILKGSYHFLSDLSRAMTIHHTVDFMSVSSYENTDTTGEVKILSKPKNTIKNRHVLIVEDILDTGTTLYRLVPILEKDSPKSIKIITLLRKPTKLQTNIKANWVGFDLDPPEFVIGYGLDYNELFRNLPYIGVPTQETINKYSV